MKYLQLLLIGILIAGHAQFAIGADHLDSPSVETDGRLDINDIYAFQSPTNSANVVLIMTVNPAAGIFSPMDFSTRGNYELNIDNNSDAITDITYAFTFSKARRTGLPQRYLVRRQGSFYASGNTGQTVSLSGGAKVRADLFEDPFFFDLNGFENGFAFTGSDFFAGLNVTAIVLEIPRTELGADNVAISARTTDQGVQFDRMGRPAINTALIPSAKKDLFNISSPVNDPANFGADVQATIESLNGGDTATAIALTSVLLPDLLTIDTSSTNGFLNGRKLTDDVIDAELGLLTNGAVTGDGVNQNDATFLTSFPFLAPPNG